MVMNQVGGGGGGVGVGVSVEVYCTAEMEVIPKLAEVQ
jgi:hypothetical protein